VQVLICQHYAGGEGAEIARSDIARPDNAVPDQKLKLP